MNIELIFEATAKSLAEMQITDIETAKKQLKGLAGQKTLTLHRKAFCAITKQETFTEFTVIGRRINRGHATVMYHCRNSPFVLRSEPEYVAIYNNVMQNVKEAIELSNKSYEGKEGLFEFVEKSAKLYGRKYRETYQNYAIRFIKEHADQMIEIVKQLPKTN